MQVFLNAVRGFCMALADSVPGVSGGTIAFLLGFYDEFINSLNDLMGRDSKKRKKAFLFLVKLGIGWIIGFGLSVLILASLFEAHIYQISSVVLWPYLVCYTDGYKGRSGGDKRTGWKSGLYPFGRSSGICHFLV